MVGSLVRREEGLEMYLSLFEVIATTGLLIPMYVVREVLPAVAGGGVFSTGA